MGDVIKYLAVAFALICACDARTPTPEGEQADSVKTECNVAYWACYDHAQAAVDDNDQPDPQSPCYDLSFGSGNGQAWDMCFAYAHAMCMPAYCECKGDEPSTACDSFR